jgi:ferredoxin-nitrite reductase
MIDPLELKKEVIERANVLNSAEKELTHKLHVLGLYSQKHKGYFMLRTRIPGGFLTAEQAKVIGEIAAEYARGPDGVAFVDLTTRQQVQMHWIRLADVPEIWERYERVGLTTLHTCGNAVRNIITCPLTGIDRYEVMDVSSIVKKINRSFLKKEYANLPRKFKISISGSRENCTFAELNDIALIPAKKYHEIGFNLLVGGGLGDTPRMASDLDVFIQPEKVLDILQGVVEFYRKKGDYENTAINRFKVLVAKMGVEKLREELENHLGFELPRAGKSLITSCRYTHIGVYPQKQEGLSYVGTCIPAGRLKAEELIEFARISNEYSRSHELRITPSQDLLLPNIPDDVLERVLDEPLLKKYTPFPHPALEGMSACSGSEICVFGIVETKKL